ncbi:MAG: Homoserine dehydrogenase [Verrucomicrobiales bacterium]|jgi:homoserine dehydrogenase|nr:Homoserine dehydrogenase [Verrucomicrobiales bacterium]MDB6129734.1 Homoserine dehydrogenase [Verrucomicrobiales bacterium]
MLSAPMQQQVNIGLIGGGTVGGGVYKALQANGALMASRLGIKISVTKVVVREIKKSRPVHIPAALLTTDFHALIHDPEIHIIVELIGGTTTARSVVEAALKAGKPVVTANKALISKHGETLFALAKANKTNLYYEASVAGGIPIIKVLRESLIGNRVVRLYGIVNGTCNYILTRMKAEGAEFMDVLADAQRLGYAEAEPSLDVDGHDAAHKTGILASLAHGFWINPQDIYVEGIRHIGKLDIQFATQLGYTIKLLGIVKCLPSLKKSKGPRQAIQVSVYPALLPKDHVMANVSGVYNAVLVRGDIVGDTLYYGRGAGQDATASSVLSDLADAALDLKCSSRDRVPAFVDHEKNGKVLSTGELVTRYYLRLGVSDRPGTLASIATILARLNIGISSVIQPEGHEGATVPLILMIHDASNASMQKALKQIEKLPVVKGAPVLIRVEDFE